MNTLPSYEDAVSGGHWLDLAAPYMPIRSYSKLCRVSRRFYSHFSPRLWNDPIQTARLLGLHPNDGEFLCVFVSLLPFIYIFSFDFFLYLFSISNFFVVPGA